MNQSVTAEPTENALIRSGLGVVSKAVLVALSIITVIMLHESVHLVVGRLLGIPAVFTGLTSAGITGQQVANYPPLSLALMNGIAPLFTVAVGFFVLHFLTRRPPALPQHLQYFLAWWAMFGIPYLGLQLLIIVAHVDYSGNGADSAAVSGYLHLPLLTQTILCVLGFLYYLGSAAWLSRVMWAVSGDMARPVARDVLPPWRRILGMLVTIAAVARTIFAASQALRGNGVSDALFDGLMLWVPATVILTPWKTQGARAAARDWLFPGIVGLLALIPLGLLSKNGNDFGDLWFISLPPVFAAVMFAARNISKPSEFIRIYRR